MIHKIFLCSTLLILSVNTIYCQKQIKEIKKEFQTSKGDVLEIENKFGDIEIMQWEKSIISVSIRLNAEAGSDSEALSIIENMEIEFSKEGSVIYAHTILDEESGNSDNKEFSINYVVYVPKWMNLNLTNKYGNIHIDDISGLVNIDIKHGNLRVNSLDRGSLDPSNQIVLAYSDAYIEKAGSLELTLAFSKFEAEEALKIILNSKYSGVKIGNCVTFEADSKYDNFKFEKIRNCIGVMQYSNLFITDFYGKFDLESNYTGVKIDQVLPSFESIKIENTRGTYKIGINEETSFDLIGNSINGDIHVSEFNILEKNTDGDKKYIHASNGTEDTGKSISISSIYGSVSLFKY